MNTSDNWDEVVSAAFVDNPGHDSGAASARHLGISARHLGVSARHLGVSARHLGVSARHLGASER
jgi:hypothetical protein